MRQVCLSFALLLCVSLSLVAALGGCASVTEQPENPPLNQRDIWNEPTLRDKVRLNAMDIEHEPTLRDTVRLNAMDIQYEPTLRDTVRLNAMDIQYEPTLRDTIVDASIQN